MHLLRSLNFTLVLTTTLLLGNGFAEAQVMTFASPGGVTEECRIFPRMPGAKYDKSDAKVEAKLCAIDFYDKAKIALCPKTWSTSPGTMVYDITATGLTQEAYEAQKSCGGSKTGHEKITKFKQTMNQKGTSGTFAPSSWLYYHFSRYFDTTVEVPVSVYRSMDKDMHFKRVTEKAHKKTMGKGAQVRAGWEWMYSSLRSPERYVPTSDLFTSDQRQIYGTLGDGSGERYGEEINGIRSRWGDQQNVEFQETPAFFALRSEKPLKDAIRDGLALGTKNSKVRAAMGGGADDFQMSVWMRELSEIVVLDYIFNQQDRVGNIDFKWYVYYVDEAGKVTNKKLKATTARAKMTTIEYPKTIGTSATKLIQRTRINDNDAGGRLQYANFTRRTKMLEKIRHMSPTTYKKLIDLDRDFKAQGEIFQYLKSTFQLNEKNVAEVVSKVATAAEILKSICLQGKLRFDLGSVSEAFNGGIQPVQLNCEKP